MGYFNIIWQGDANAMALAALTHASTPPSVVNIAGPEELSVRDRGHRAGAAAGHRRHVHGRRGGRRAAQQRVARLGAARRSPRVDLEQLIDWTADWSARGGDHLGKPTHFESRDGRF